MHPPPPAGVEAAEGLQLSGSRVPRLVAILSVSARAAASCTPVKRNSRAPVASSVSSGPATAWDAFVNSLKA